MGKSCVSVLLPWCNEGTAFSSLRRQKAEVMILARGIPQLWNTAIQTTDPVRGATAVPGRVPLRIPT
ncbi:hypothetical protein WL14_04310 [Burkholderia cepacia]|nr:hypothetical protein WJ46_31330 [Burkholderia cepacia]KVQ28589.1 hypothetical protein WK01_16775 [Burkholderia cepacia]KVQ32690.1 hypothetical protein WK02_11960 [Burkholderia cepacia]KVZ16581.1 hypothetical protein WL14_04310 [Burkholderia cepacia]KWB16127.1 hypothetical protein WL32_26135 [Burkholderia cepacia]